MGFWSAMASFIIVAKAAPAGIRESLSRSFGEYREVSPAAWLVKSSLLDTQQISQVLFPRDEKGNAAVAHIVFRLDAFWGWHDKGIWEWLSKKDS